MNEMVVRDVIINCQSDYGCSEVQEVFSSLKRGYSDLKHFYTVFKLYVSNEGIKELSFSLDGEEENLVLRLDLKLKDRIVSIDEPEFEGDHEVTFPSVIPMKVDDFLDDRKLKETEGLFSEVARDHGFPDAKVSIDKEKVGNGLGLRPRVRLGKPIIIDEINVSSKSVFLKTLLMKKFRPFVNQPFNIQLLKSQLEQARQTLAQYDYYLAYFNFRYKRVSDRKVKILFEIINTNRYAFYVKSTDERDVVDLKEFLKENLISSKRELNNESIEFLVKDFYDLRGYKFISVKSELHDSGDLNNERMFHYMIDVDKGKQSLVASIQFSGNSFFTDKDIREMYKESASDLASLGIYDFKFYESFKEILREKYIENGFLSAHVEEPSIQFRTSSKQVVVSFKIREGMRTTVSSLKLNGLNFADDMEIRKILTTQKGNFFNPIEFKKDLGQIEDYLKKNGYYFVEIQNLNKKNIVKYFSDNSRVDIEIDIETGPKVYTNQILIIGNKTTRKTLIKRELKFKSGSLLTKEAVEQSQANLLRLGIFSTVRIKPVSSDKNKTDILIFVKEKDFGVIELAPGVRSDLGLKLSGAVSYNNLDGMNKRISLQGTINRRFDLYALDDERRTSRLNLIEYDTSINYLENHIFYSDYNVTVSTSQARRRFVSYDADIQRVGYSVATQYTSWLSASIRQQVEIVSQFNATPTRDEVGTIIDDSNHGHFQIGSFTPQVNFDFRNRKVNPSSGAEFDLSVELANPFFLSQSNDELTIDYYKLISRNKFYLPFSDQTTLAISATFGVQENLADDDDYIPGIKVFRLSGADIVRGYEDNEINTLPSGNDISTEQVNNKAYMANIKIEPRYALTDSTVIGLFYDAGRIFIDEFAEADLRSSVGLSFKYVTPVGTLDVDYGIKTLRKADSSGSLETPGRLHLSIGFF